MKRVRRIASLLLALLLVLPLANVSLQQRKKESRSAETSLSLARWRTLRKGR